MYSVSVDSHSDPSIVRLLLRKGKTNPYGNGVSVCGVSSGCLAPVPGHPSLPQWPAVHLARWLPFDPATVNPKVRMMLQLAGLCSFSYVGHSFCIGAATMAAHTGLPSHLIKMLGRWESEVYQFVHTDSQRDFGPSVLPSGTGLFLALCP